MSKVVIGMSGGVDSSVAASLLKEQGYDVIGITMEMWNGEEVTSKAVNDARKVASDIGIPFHVVDFKDEFKCKVIDYFKDEYLHGRTPNPCIQCNRHLKWGALLNEADKLGADYIATGHYSSVVKLDNGRYALKRAENLAKDQTYALYRLTQEQLARTIMPVGKYSKDEVRSKAESIGICVADKPDSQDICFIPDGDYAKFIKDNTDEEIKEGNFVAPDGKIVGRHKGIIHYTVGQRKGLGVALGYPAFVIEIRPETNEVVIGSKEESLIKSFKINNLNFMAVEDITEPVHLFTKIRYNHKGTYCTVERTGEDELTCTFDNPEKAVTPGQAAVFYKDDLVVGGGTII